MNNHEYYEELVNLKVDKMLSPEQESELNAHLETCRECRERLDIYLTIRNLSDELLEEPPENFASGVMYKVGLEKKRNSFKSRLFSRIFTITGAAAAIAILIYSGAFKSIVQTNKEAAGSLTTADTVSAAADETAPNRSNGTRSAVPPEANAAADQGTGTSGTAKKGAEAETESAPEAPAPTSDGQSKAPGLFGFTAAATPAANTFDPSTAKIGDAVAGLEISDIEISGSGDVKNVRVVFDGETTLSGTLFFDDNENAKWGKFIYFYADDDSASLLPYPVNDDRQVWFGIDNYDDAVKMLDVQPEDEGKTISYHAVIVIDSYTVIQSSSEGCNYASLKRIESSSRLPE